MIQFTISVLEPETCLIRKDGKIIGKSTDGPIQIGMSSKDAEAFMTKEVIAEMKAEHKRIFPNGKIRKVLTLN